MAGSFTGSFTGNFADSKNKNANNERDNDNKLDDVVDVQIDEMNVMKKLYEHVWTDLLQPLLVDRTIINVMSNESRKIKAFQRYMIGNLFILTKHNVNEGVEEIINRLKYMVSDSETIQENIDEIVSIYRTELEKLHQFGTIDTNEYLNSLDIVIMIPPNILKKDVY